MIFQNIQLNRRERVLIVVSILIIFLRFYSIYLVPIGGRDCNWSMAMSFTAINGEWFFNTYDEHTASSLYGYFALPIISFYNGVYSMFILFESIRILFCIIIIKWLISHRIPSVMIGLITLLFFLDRQLLYQRQEALIVPIIFCFYYFWLRKDKHRFKGFVILTFMLVLIHPMAALLNGLIYFSLFVNTFDKLKKVVTDKSNIVTTIFFLVGITAYLSSTLFTTVQQEFSQRVDFNFNFSTVTDFMLTSFPLTVFLFIVRWQQQGKIRLLLTTIGFVFIISLINGNYYYSYYQLYLILDIVFNLGKGVFMLSKKSKHVGVFLLVISFYSSILNDFFVYIENPNYSNTVHEIITEVSQYQSNGKDVYISPEFALPLLKNPNTRMLLAGKPFHLWSKEQLCPGDALLFTERQEYESFKLEATDLIINCREIVPAPQGMLSIKRLYRERVNKYGLWECVVLKNE